MVNFNQNTDLTSTVQNLESESNEKVSEPPTTTTTITTTTSEITTITTNKPERKFFGLKNMGNTCYVNSCLQALYNTNKFRENIIKNQQIGPLHNSLGKLFIQMKTICLKQTETAISNEKWPVIKPDEFINEFRSLKPQFVKNEQHDAQEFFTILLECIHQEANIAHQAYRPEKFEARNAQEAWQFHFNYIDNSIYSQLFVGQLESSLKCLTCNHISLSWDCFWQLSLYLKENPITDKIDCNNNNNNIEFMQINENNENKKDSEENKDTSLSIKECIKDYMDKELLTDDSAPFCENCKQKCNSIKQQSICRTPHYLIVHLKRFTHTGTKINRKVTVNSILNLGDKKFAINACVLHRGTETVGHYFTLFNHNKEWILFDDEGIYSMNDDYVDSILQVYSYICIYRAISYKK